MVTSLRFRLELKFLAAYRTTMLSGAIRQVGEVISADMADIPLFRATCLDGGVLQVPEPFRDDTAYLR